MGSNTVTVNSPCVMVLTLRGSLKTVKSWEKELCITLMEQFIGVVFIWVRNMVRVGIKPILENPTMEGGI
jgi:hypothetical protein